MMFTLSLKSLERATKEAPSYITCHVTELSSGLPQFRTLTSIFRVLGCKRERVLQCNN